MQCAVCLEASTEIKASASGSLAWAHLDLERQNMPGLRERAKRSTGKRPDA